MLLGELVYSDRSQLLSFDLEADGGVQDGNTAAVKWDAASESARAEARWRADHVREVLTGFKSGCAELALPHEPYARFRPTLPLGKRVKAKAADLGVSKRTIQRWMSDFHSEGVAGLLHGKAVQPTLGSERFASFEDTLLEVMQEYVDQSRPTCSFLIRHARSRFIARFGDSVTLPSKRTARRILDKLEQRHPILQHSTKRNRDIASRSLLSYGKLRPMRPGEYVLMDTTRLDVYAMDPDTLRWVPVDLTVAMDWYSRCIVGLRLTPRSTKAIDAASVLYQCFRPMPAGRDWPDDAVWPPHGIPRSVLVEQEVLTPGSFGAAGPAIVPDTIVIDHGRIFVGEHLTSACRSMGISIQPARLRKGSDKGPVERFFLTVRTGFLQELPGYKGPDVYSRGLEPENEAYYTIDELEMLLREWVACVYHTGRHKGAREPHLWGLKMWPAQMFEHGIARAGYLEVPKSKDLAYHFLKVEWRTVQHGGGVEIDGRVYRGAVLMPYVGRKSRYSNRKGQWPIHINPDDITRVFFFDAMNTQQWHAVEWTEAREGPMNEDGLKFGRSIVRKKYRYSDDKLALAELLERRNLSQGHTMEERRAALRLARQQHTLGLDAAAGAEPPTPHRRPAINGNDPIPETADEAAHFEDDLDEQPPEEDESFYDDTLEDL